MPAHRRSRPVRRWKLTVQPRSRSHPMRSVSPASERSWRRESARRDYLRTRNRRMVTASDRVLLIASGLPRPDRPTLDPANAVRHGSQVLIG
jgi:hypothetical protein